MISFEEPEFIHPFIFIFTMHDDATILRTYTCTANRSD